MAVTAVTAVYDESYPCFFGGFFNCKFHFWFLCKSELRNFQKLTLLESRKRCFFLSKFLSGYSFQGTVVNLELPSLDWGWLEITLSVPLNKDSLSETRAQYKKQNKKTINSSAEIWEKLKIKVVFKKWAHMLFIDITYAVFKNKRTCYL